MLCVYELEVAEAEALDGGEDVIGGFGPAEWFWIGVDSFDVGQDVGFELPGRAMNVHKNARLTPRGRAGYRRSCQRRSDVNPSGRS